MRPASPRPLWSRFADMGYTGMLVPEAFGGAGLGMVEAGVLMEADRPPR